MADRCPIRSCSVALLCVKHLKSPLESLQLVSNSINDGIEVLHHCRPLIIPYIHPIMLQLSSFRLRLRPVKLLAMLYRPRRPYSTIITGVAAVLTMYSYDAYRKRGCSADLVIVIPYRRFVIECYGIYKCNHYYNGARSRRSYRISNLNTKQNVSNSTNESVYVCGFPSVNDRQTDQCNANGDFARSLAPI